MKVQGHFDTTEEQRDMEANREVPDTPEHYNPYARYYQECLKQREQGINYGESCMKYIQYISTVHAYNFHAKYENVSLIFCV